MSERITKELLEEVIRGNDADGDIYLKHFTISEGCEKGGNFSSDIFSVKAEVEKRKEELIEHLIVKVPLSVNTFKLPNSRSQFVNESVAYCSLIPAMVQLQLNKGVPPFGPSVPQHRFGVGINNVELIVLEDLRQSGYKLLKVPPLDYDHCRLVMTELARFHSLAYALKIYDPDKSKQILSHLIEGRWVFPLVDLYKETFNISLAVAEKFTKDEKIISTIETLRSKGPENLLKHLIQPTEPYAVICHGDLWYNNMMFSYQSVDGTEVPSGVKLFDLQRIRYSLPTIDLSAFFYSSTTKEMRRKILNDLLAVYHSNFIESLKLLKLDFPEFSLDVLAKLYKQSALYGIVFMFIALPVLLVGAVHPHTFSGKDEEAFREQTLDLSTLLLTIGDDPNLVREKFIEPLEDILEMDLL